MPRGLWSERVPASPGWAKTSPEGGCRQSLLGLDTVLLSHPLTYTSTHFLTHRLSYTHIHAVTYTHAIHTHSLPPPHTHTNFPLPSLKPGAPSRAMCPWPRLLPCPWPAGSQLSCLGSHDPPPSHSRRCLSCAAGLAPRGRRSARVSALRSLLSPTLVQRPSGSLTFSKALRDTPPPTGQRVGPGPQHLSLAGALGEREGFTTQDGPGQGVTPIARPPDTEPWAAHERGGPHQSLAAGPG